MPLVTEVDVPGGKAAIYITESGKIRFEVPSGSYVLDSYFKGSGEGDRQNVTFVSVEQFLDQSNAA